MKKLSNKAIFWGSGLVLGLTSVNFAPAQAAGATSYSSLANWARPDLGALGWLNQEAKPLAAVETAGPQTSHLLGFSLSSLLTEVADTVEMTWGMRTSGPTQLSLATQGELTPHPGDQPADPTLATPAVSWATKTEPALTANRPGR